MIWRNVRLQTADYTDCMTQTAKLQSLGLFDSRVPRYTSYPTAPVFGPAVAAVFQTDCLRGLAPDVPISVYVHIPFCERLCWFCACRTQGTRTLSPVETYIETLEAELALLAAALPHGVRMGRLHWGGGTPTILPPHLIRRLAQAIKSVIPPADPFEFSVEIDPTLVDAAKIAALQAEGMTRASIGIQDFSETVQKAIGRQQSFEATAYCVQILRDAGISSLNADLVYGLPHQTPYSIAESVDKVLSLSPDRIALFGYAHVPWMAKRQKLIDEATLPGDTARHDLANVAADRFVAAGFTRIGIDHFALPGDGLSLAAQNRTLRRNFQGYTEDTCQTLLGLGASAISRFEGGYVQNAAATAAYTARIAAGNLAGYRGHVLTADDRLRARAIEMLLCDFHLDFRALCGAFNVSPTALSSIAQRIATEFDGLVAADSSGLTILPAGKPLARIIAQRFDAYPIAEARFSKVS